MPDAGSYIYTPNQYELDRRRRREARKEARRWRGWKHHQAKPC